MKTIEMIKSHMADRIVTAVEVYKNHKLLTKLNTVTDLENWQEITRQTLGVFFDVIDCKTNKPTWTLLCQASNPDYFLAQTKRMSKRPVILRVYVADAAYFA